MQSDPVLTPTPIHPDPQIAHALSRGHLFHMTTTGRKSGQPRRIELVFHNIDGRVIVSGKPGRRDWYANVLANPDITFHLVGPVQADLPALARPITEPVERRRVMEQVASNWRSSDHIELFMERSPLIEVTFPQAEAA
ncbi:MAG TPA: nitroreductase family deazaflavin-dependent oxidoreductase [Candidatus Limnocylindria bacterium]|jgi:deazaflavin-dependent oxidoreductase (nitroreductase family)